MGDDILVGSNGTVLTGGGGADFFEVRATTGASGTAAPVTITDYDRDADQLRITVTYPEGQEPPDVSMVVDVELNEVRFVMGSRTLAVLQGVSEPGGWGLSTIGG